MGGMNRRTEDGRPILIDGAYDDVYHIHASTGAVTPDELDAVIAASNAHAADAFTAYLAGTWSLDIDATAAQSPSLPGRPTAPITAEMEDDGRFTVTAPGIAFDLFGMETTVGLTATGHLEIEARLEDDRVQYRAVAANIGIDHTKADIGGIFDIGPVLELFIRQLLSSSTKPQDVVIKPDGADETFVLSDPEVTHVLRRPKPTGTRKFLRPTPFKVRQPNRSTCWAAAMGSFINTLTCGNMPPEVKSLKSDFLTTDAVIQRMIEKGVEDGKTYVDPATHLLVGPNALELWQTTCAAFDISETPNLPPLKTLTLDIIRSHIDANRYVLIMYHDRGWNPLPGHKEYDPSKPLSWHVVICYGYDTQFSEMLLMDPEIGGNLALRIDPGSAYIIVGQQALPFSY